MSKKTVPNNTKKRKLDEQTTLNLSKQGQLLPFTTTTTENTPPQECIFPNNDSYFHLSHNEVEGVANELNNQFKYGKLRLVTREQIIPLLKEMDSLKEKFEFKKHKVITGIVGVGKTVFLLHTIIHCRRSGWLVLYLYNYSSFYWDESCLERVLRRHKEINKEILSSLKLNTEFKNLTTDNTLYDLLNNFSEKEVKEILIFYLNQLKCVKDYPVLIAVDKFNEFITLANENQSFENQILNCLSNLKRGLFIGATSSFSQLSYFKDFDKFDFFEMKEFTKKEFNLTLQMKFQLFKENKIPFFTQSQLKELSEWSGHLPFLINLFCKCYFYAQDFEIAKFKCIVLLTDYFYKPILYLLTKKESIPIIALISNDEFCKEISESWKNCGLLKWNEKRKVYIPVCPCVKSIIVTCFQFHKLQFVKFLSLTSRIQ
ncbi:hypothetical protein ABK040_014468 [Willaertia magna]